MGSRVSDRDPQRVGRAATDDHREIGDAYAKYVLGVLVLVYVLNFTDRQILSILAQDIKADIGVTDAQMGFLYGTAFAVFYALFGIPLGRLADTWIRKSLISIGLLVWSGMTALSGTARGFASLATYRIGVGVGEASATPAAFSMLSDYFPPKLRATALAIYSSGIYIGAGIGLFLGGVIVDTWKSLFPDRVQAPFHLRGWQVAFFAVALPGILMSLWVWSLREPARGSSEGYVARPHPHPFRETWRTLASLLPIMNIVSLVAIGVGAKGLAINVGAGAAIACAAWLSIQLTGDSVQWIALGVGVYAAVSWAQHLAASDRATFAMIFKSRALLVAVVGFASLAFVTYGLGFWMPSFFQRAHGVSATEAGTVLGLSTAIGGWAGVTFGGVIADWMRERHQHGRLYVGMASALLALPAAIGALVTDNVTVAFAFNFIYCVTSPMWLGPAASTVNDLVLPRMRATASAFYLLMLTFVGLALGPYTIGRVSDRTHASGASSADALRHGMLWGTSMLVVALVALLFAARSLKQDEDTRLERALALGEDVPQAIRR